MGALRSLLRLGVFCCSAVEHDALNEGIRFLNSGRRSGGGAADVGVDCCSWPVVCNLGGVGESTREEGVGDTG